MARIPQHLLLGNDTIVPRYRQAGCRPDAAIRVLTGSVLVLRYLALCVRSSYCSGWFRLRGVRSPWIQVDGPLPRLDARGEITIGERLFLLGRLLRSDIGAAPSAYLHVGDRVMINQGCVIVAHCGIKIGDDSMIGEFSAIYDTNHHPLDEEHSTKYAPVTIGRNVWLGRNVTVLPGSKIGDDTVVAAGSIVKGDLPPRVLADGNPARPVKGLKVSDGWERQERPGRKPRLERARTVAER